MKSDRPVVDYWQYLRSDEWKARRRDARHRAGNQCQDCSVSNVVLHVHHLTYERLGQELASDLRVLCLTCHAERHDGLGDDPCAPAWVKENPWLARVLRKQHTADDDWRTARGIPF
jgi:5-methylcytosine-specific restriction endonuclease McrA